MLFSEMVDQLAGYNSGLVYYTKEVLGLLLLVCFGQLGPFCSEDSDNQTSSMDFLKINFEKKLKHDFLELYLKLIG